MTRQGAHSALLLAVLALGGWLLVAPPPAAGQEGTPWNCYRATAKVPDRLGRYMQNLVREISASIDEEPDFVLCEARDFSDVVAAQPAERRIIYDRGTFMGMAMGGPKNEAALVLISHEVGHVLLGHGRSGEPAARKREELLADQFAGFAARRLGVRREAASGILSLLMPVDRDSPGYPSRSARIAAYEKGHDRGTRPPASALPASGAAQEAAPEDDSATAAEENSAAGDEDGGARAGDTPAPADTKGGGGLGGFARAGLDFFKEAMEYIAGVAAGIGALYGAYVWLRRRLRRRRAKAKAEAGGDGLGAQAQGGAGLAGAGPGSSTGPDGDSQRGDRPS